MKKTYLLLIILIFLMYSLDCRLIDDDNDDDGTPVQGTITEQTIAKANTHATSVKTSFIEANNRFSLDLFKKVMTQETKNAMISPFSINTVLSMSYIGATGETKSEMANVLHYDTITTTEVSDGFYDLLNSLMYFDSKIELYPASSIWLGIIYVALLENSYVDTLREKFSSSVKFLDFKSGKADNINTWIANATKNRITNMLDSVDTYLSFYLVSAIYFKGEWSLKFEENFTRKDEFYKPNQTIEVNMMNNEFKEYLHFEDEKAVSVAMPYGSKHLYFYAIMPSKGTLLKDFINSMDYETLKRYTENVTQTHVNLTIPKFKFDYGKLSVDGYLKGLGMNRALTDKAQFFNIIKYSEQIKMIADSFDTPDKDYYPYLYINKLEHQTKIEVNENGAEAIAVTVSENKGGCGVVMKESDVAMSMPIFVKFDRPFMFLIRDNRSGAILFTGKVEDPNLE